MNKRINKYRVSFLHVLTFVVCVTMIAALSFWGSSSGMLLDKVVSQAKQELSMSLDDLPPAR